MSNTLVEVMKLGSHWYDNNAARWLVSGDLKMKIDEDEYGRTVNPTIFEKAITRFKRTTTSKCGPNQRRQERKRNLRSTGHRRHWSRSRHPKPVYDKTDRVDGYISWK